MLALQHLLKSVHRVHFVEGLYKNSLIIAIVLVSKCRWFDIMVCYHTEHLRSNRLLDDRLTILRLLLLRIVRTGLR